MSYILDALKRADAERGRSRSSALAEADASAGNPVLVPTRESKRMPLVWGASLAALLLGGTAALVWQRWGDTEPANPVALSPAAPDNAPPATPPPAPTDAPVLVAESTPAAEPAAPPPPVLPILAKAPPKPPVRAPAPPAPKAPTQDTSPEAQASGQRTATAAQATAAEPASVPTLSAEARAALPAIQVSGSSYSANREHRMLIANGQVVKEGQELSPGLTLEVIGPRSAVFNHRGTRFNVNY